MAEVKTLLKEARKFIDDKDFKSAQECCKNILRKDKQNYLALVLLGKSLQDSDQAPLAYQKAIASKPTQPLAWHGLATYYERKEDDASKAKLFAIYGEMLKLQLEDGKVTEILTKLGELGSSLKNSDSITSIINYINENHEDTFKNEAVKQFIQLLKSNVPCKSEDVPLALNILNDLYTKDPSDYLMLLICKLILQKSDFVSAVEEIIALDLFSNIEVKKWLCEQLCESFIDKNSFNGLDIQKYIDIITVGIETSKYVGLLKSMISFDKGLYLEAYKQCVPLVNYQETEKIEATFIIKCTIMLKKWPVTQKLATNFLMKVRNPELKLNLQKFLFLSYVEQQKWLEAINIAKEISTTHLNTDELASLAKCYIETNESAEHVLENLDKDQFIQLQCLALLKQEKYKEAISVLENCNENALNYYYLGNAYWYLKEYDSCLINLLKSAKVNSDHADTFYFLGIFYDQYKKDLQKAKKCYEKAYSLCDYESNYVKNLSEVYVKMGLNESDFELLKKAKTTLQNKETWLNLRLGLHYLNKREWENAIINFRDVVKASPNNLIALECLADAYYSRGSYTSALRVYNKVMSLNPNKIHSCHCLTNIGCIYALLAQYGEAIATFEKVFEIDPFFLLGLKGFAECSMKIARKKFEANLYGSARDSAQCAIDNLTKALLKGRKFMCLWNLLGDALMFVTRLPNKYSYVFIKEFFDHSNETTIRKDKLDIYPQAIACFSFVAKHKQELASYNLASAYFEYYRATNQIAHCHVAFNLMLACIKEKPTAWRNWNLLGKICVFLKRYDWAQHCFIKALTVTHKWSIAKIWCNLGTLYLQVNLYKLANHCFWRGQSALPSYPQSWIGQALIAEVIRKEEAMDLFRHACRLGYHPTSALGYADWICSTVKNLNWKNDPESKYAIEGLYAVTYGIDLMEWYLTFEPDDPWACNILGNLQERKGLLNSALKSYQKAHLHAEDDKKNLVLLNMARILVRLEKYDEAIKTYKAIDEAGLDSSCGLALALYKTGQYEDSFSVYDMALQWLCNDDADKADILVAMAGIVHMFKGKDDAKTLLFHSIQASQKKPTPYSLFSLCSLGIINSDQSLTMSALNELQKYEKDSNFAFDIGFLKSYVACNEDIELAIQIICDALHNHPSNGPLWFCMSQYCLRTSQSKASIASGCAQRAFKLSTYEEHNSYDIGKMFAIASIAEYNAGDRVKSLKFGKEGLHINPCHSELWAAVLFTLMSNKKWSSKKRWILAMLGYMRKHLTMTRPLSRWVTLVEKKLTR
ncbi:superkiller complex protein 3-like [Epargyreus clarus]|uniref:superkiller complex protein 3-like n=1 Tax=Epargyreus clarus TaxID=520877 RepID=UPI003C2B6B2B